MFDWMKNVLRMTAPQVEIEGVELAETDEQPKYLADDGSDKSQRLIAAGDYERWRWGKGGQQWYRRRDSK